MWIRITSNHFCACVKINTYKFYVEEAAPILWYMEKNKWSVNKVKSYCRQKQWKWKEL